MRKLKLFEDFTSGINNFTSGSYSNWPKQKHSRGVKVNRELFLKDIQDREEIENHVLQSFEKNGEFRNWVSGGKVNIPGRNRIIFLEIIRPDGITEIMSFEDFERYEEDDHGINGYLTSTTLDDKYTFTIEANSYESGEYEIGDFNSLDWELNKN